MACFCCVCNGIHCMGSHPGHFHEDDARDAITAAVRTQRERDAQVCRDIARQHEEDASQSDDAHCREAHEHCAAAAHECAEAIQREE